MMKKLMASLLAVLLANAALAGTAFAQTAGSAAPQVVHSAKQNKEEMTAPPSLSRVCVGTFCCTWVDETRSPYCH